MKVRESLSVLGERNFRWFFASRFVNLVGGTMATVAVAFAVLEVSDSASALGQVLAARTVPLVLFLLVGGVVADRFPRVLVIQLSNALACATQAVVAYLVLTGQAEIWQLVVLETLNGTSSAMSMPAMQGLIPQLVQRSHLQPANVLLSMSRGVLNVVGPSVAAALVVTVGPGWALAIDAATWGIAGLLLLPVAIPAGNRDEGSGFLTDLREGWTLFRSTTWLWVVVTAFGVLNAIHAGALFTLGPVIAKDEPDLGEQGWGMALSAEALGLLAMTALLLKAPLRRPLLAGMLGMLVFTLPLLALGFSPSVGTMALAMLLAGLGMEVFSLGWSLAMQENVPEEKLSRAYSYDMLGSFVAMPVGQLAYGPLGETFGHRNVLVASGVVYAAVCLATLAVPSVRRLPRAGAAG